MSDEVGRHQPARSRGTTSLLADAIPLLCLLSRETAREPKVTSKRGWLGPVCSRDCSHGSAGAVRGRLGAQGRANSAVTIGVCRSVSHRTEAGDAAAAILCAAAFSLVSACAHPSRLPLSLWGTMLSPISEYCHPIIREPMDARQPRALICDMESGECTPAVSMSDDRCHTHPAHPIRELKVTSESW